MQRALHTALLWLAAIPSCATAQDYPRPQTPYDAIGGQIVKPGDETLAQAIADAYRTSPVLNARRYDLRAIDEGAAQARAQLRPTAELQIQGGYDRTVPGRMTQAGRPEIDRIFSDAIERNDLQGQIVVTQPLSTGGRASAALDAALGDVRIGREGLRREEGDLLAQVISAYVDVRRDTRILAIRKINVEVLEGTLAEVAARRKAGEMTRTDVAQTESQLSSARVQLLAAEAQMEASRAAFAVVVGRNPGRLVPEPPLPLMPGSIDAAFDGAIRQNPELAAAVQTERASRARIAGARAEGAPTVSLRGTVGLTSADPTDVYEYDQGLTGRLVLTVPLSQGGRVRSLTAQALDRNSADRLRIEATRRQVVQNVAAAWNQLVAGERIVSAQQAQLASARVYYEGALLEYRAGLRSTFDVLYAQNALRDVEVGLISSERELYVAQATLLRQIGVLEAGKLLGSIGLYDPSINLRHSLRRNALPWDKGVRALDRLGGLNRDRQTIDALPPVSEAILKDAPSLDTGRTIVTDIPVTTPVLGSGDD